MNYISRRTIASGFTLVEMLVTITIVIVVSGMSIAGVVTFNQIQGNEDDAKAMLTELRRVYSKATGIEYPTGCSSLSGYQVTIPASNSTNQQSGITITALCSPANVVETRAGVLKTSYFNNNNTEVNFIIKPSTGQLQAVAPTALPVNLTLVSKNSATTQKIIEVRDFGVFNIQ